jgi:CRP-like cAMP-binding protein
MRPYEDNLMGETKMEAGAGNRILASLSPSEWGQMLGIFEPVTLRVHQMLFHVGDVLEYAWFPSTAVASLVCLLESGKSVEIGLVGYEGMVGSPVLFGSTKATYSAEVLVPGHAIKVRIETLRQQAALHTSFYRLLMLHSQSLMAQFSQLAACNLCHHIPERVCRWLLLLHDRTKLDEFQLTHEQIAERLGIRRAGITIQLGQLEALGAIQASRGKLKVIDRRKLEAVACECYRCLANESQLHALPQPTIQANALTASPLPPPLGTQSKRSSSLQYA